MPGSFGSLFLQVMLIYYYNKEEIARAAIDWLSLCEGVGEGGGEALRYHPLIPTNGANPTQSPQYTPCPKG